MIFINILSLILKLIPIFLVLVILWFVFSDEDKNVFAMIKRNQSFFIRRLVPLLLAVVIFFGLNFFAECAKEVFKCEMTVGLNYLEASSGLNPNKTKFTASEFTADGVMEKIIEKGGYDIDEETLKEGFRVTPVRIDGSVSLESPYVATEYSVEFTAEKDLAGYDPSEVMEYYESAFSEYFTETYSRKTNVLNLDFSEVEDADYLDIYDILTAKAEEIEDYMTAMSGVSSTFISPESGESFISIYQKVNNYKNVSLENYQSFILQNGISKDRAQYIVKRTYQNLLINKDYEKAHNAYTTYINVIDRYERDMATAVLVPTRDRDGEFYMSRTKLGVDNFSKSAEDSATSASSYLAKIESNNNVINSLSTHTDSDILIERAESMIESLTDGLSEYAELAKNTAIEYENQNSEGYLTFVGEEQSNILAAAVQSAVGYSLVMLVILVVFALLKPRKDEKTRGREQTL